MSDERADPQVALALVGAEDEVGGRAAGPACARRGGRGPGAAARRGRPGHRLEHLDDDRVVEVGDESRRPARERPSTVGGSSWATTTSCSAAAPASASTSAIPASSSAHAARPAPRSAPGAASVTSHAAASARASSAARMAGPAIRVADRLGGDDEHRRPHRPQRLQRAAVEPADGREHRGVHGGAERDEDGERQVPQPEPARAAIAAAATTARQSRRSLGVSPRSRRTSHQPPPSSSASQPTATAAAASGP